MFFVHIQLSPLFSAETVFDLVQRNIQDGGSAVGTGERQFALTQLPDQGVTFFQCKFIVCLDCRFTCRRGNGMDLQMLGGSLLSLRIKELKEALDLAKMRQFEEYKTYIKDGIKRELLTA
ncbi:MAG: hypothetical protein J6C30_04295, partial [Lentisphaeria bacterium]|nr:hypothetical protein [Lentisphaeria bacterium]